MAVTDEDQGIPDDPGDEWWDDADGEGIRGWIPPDDRLWRHPSESGARAPAGATTGPSGPAGPAARLRSGPWLVGGATACVVLALVATGLVIITVGSSDQGDPGGAARVASLLGVPTTEAGVSRMPDAAAIAGMVSTARPSVVALSVGTPTGTAVGTGIVAESGGIIVTASQLVTAARTVTVIETNGTRQPADIIGIDKNSGLAVVRIADDLPAASFDVTDPAVDSVAVAVALRPGQNTGTPPVAKVYAGTVSSAGRAAGVDQAIRQMSVSVVDAPMAGDDIGCPLLDAGGQVSGLLEWTGQVGGTTTAVFLPAEVVLGVAQQLVTSGEVDHGWLGIETGDVAGSHPVTAQTATTTAGSSLVDGARLDSIDLNSPAAQAGLQVGDVVVGIDGNPVHSPSELEARLYPDAPGTALDLRLVRDGTTITVPVRLAEGNSDAP